MPDKLNDEQKNVFFVVGAAKSGTSSIYKYLESHPEIHMCPQKDVACYFCSSYGEPITLEQYKSMLLPMGEYKVAGDGCHAYLTDNKSAEWIAKEFPNAKIIIILRNPVDKIYSQYQWLVSHGLEYLESFEGALEAEDSRFEHNVFKDKSLLQGYKPNYLYFRSALYSEQIQRYIVNFDREKILFLKFDDLMRDSAKIMREIYEFLGVSIDWIADLKVYNKARTVKSIQFQYFCMSRLARCLPWRIVKFLMNMNMSSKPPQKMAIETRQKLFLKYRDDILKTESLTGMSLQEWFDD